MRPRVACAGTLAVGGVPRLYVNRNAGVDTAAGTLDHVQEPALSHDRWRAPAPGGYVRWFFPRVPGVERRVRGRGRWR